MSLKSKLGTILIITILLLSSSFIFLFREVVTSGANDVTAPELTSVTGDRTYNAGEPAIISAQFSDNIAVTSAKLYYKPASALRWSSTSILNGSAAIPLPAETAENWNYYIVIDDAAGNGPIGDPSNDGTQYYTITVTQNPDMNTSDHMMENPEPNTSLPHAFFEVGTKVVCSECPKIAALLDQMYKSGNYQFYYVGLPSTDPISTERLTQYNLYGYPTMYVDGGYRVLMGSTIQKLDIEQAINEALTRPKPNITLSLQAQRDQGTGGFTITGMIHNNEGVMYHGHLRVYLTEIVSASGESNTPQRFQFREFLIDDDVEISAMGMKEFTATGSLGTLDPENIMIYAAVFNAETQPGFSQPPDKNSFDAHYVDAVSAALVVEGGNIPPEVGILYPQVKYFHRLGYPARKSMLGRTILLGQATVIANVSDDSGIAKVEFYVNGKLMKTVEQPPYRWTWHQLAFGKKTIVVKAYDDQGKSSSASLDVFVMMKWKNPFLNLFTPDPTKSTSGSTTAGCCS